MQHCVAALCAYLLFKSHLCTSPYCLTPLTMQKLDYLFILLLQGSQDNFWFSFPTNGITEAHLKEASPLITVLR